MKPATTLLIAALATSLSGCKGFLQAFDFSRHSSAPQYAIGPADLDEGRAQLAAGNPGNAIYPLHRAALNPQTSGEALNALGVAYARLGRADLAERYFIAATKVDPSNESYVANLDEFYRSKLGIDPRVLYAQRQRAEKQLAQFAANDEAADVAHDTPKPDTRVVQNAGQTHTITVANPARSQRIRLNRQVSDMGQADAVPTAPRVVVASGETARRAASSRPAEIQISSTRPIDPVRVKIRQAAASESYPVRVRLAPRTTRARIR